MHDFCITFSTIFCRGASPLPKPYPHPSAPIPNFWIRHWLTVKAEVENMLKNAVADDLQWPLQVLKSPKTNSGSVIGGQNPNIRYTIYAISRVKYLKRMTQNCGL